MVSEKNYYAAVATLYRDDGSIDKKAMSDYFSFLLEKKVKGFFPCGTSGEYFGLTMQENLTILQLLLDINKDAHVLPCASTTSLHTTLQLICKMEQLGIREVSICPPYYVPLKQPDILDYYLEILKNTKCSLYLYNIPAFTNQIEFATFEKLMQHDRILGIKDSSGNMKTISRYISLKEQTRPFFKVMTGTDEIILPALALGCFGSVTVLSGIIPEVHNRLYEIYETNPDEARVIQHKITRLAVLCEEIVFPVGYKLALEVRGFKMKCFRQNVFQQSDAATFEKTKNEIAKCVHELLNMLNN